MFFFFFYIALTHKNKFCHDNSWEIGMVLIKAMLMYLVLVE